MALEALEDRALCAVAPAHVVLPTTGILGATLRADGSVEIYGNVVPGFPSEVVISDDTEGPYSGSPTAADYEVKAWVVSEDGRLISNSPIDPASAGTTRVVHDVSPDGNWLVGFKTAVISGPEAEFIVWRRGQSDFAPIAVPADMVGGPMVVGVSNHGDVIYRAYVGEDFKQFAWSRTAGLLPLKSLYEVEGNSSADAASFTINSISADGRTIVGYSGGDELPHRATIWVDGEPRALPWDGPSSIALSVSDDGRVVGGSVKVDEYAPRSAVWVDGVLQPLSFEDVSQLGYVAGVVNGIGDDPDAWAAIGWVGDWLAGSDGTVRNLPAYLQEQYGLSLTGGGFYSMELLASDDALYVVLLERPSFMCAGFNCSSSGKYATHLLVLPNDYSHNETAALDVNGDGQISPVDVLIVINAINENAGKPLIDLPELRQAIPNIDANGDGELSAVDAMAIINVLNRPATTTDDSSSPEGEGEAAADATALAADEFFAQLEPPVGKKSRRGF